MGNFMTFSFIGGGNRGPAAGKGKMLKLMEKTSMKTEERKHTVGKCSNRQKTLYQFKLKT
jgi:hypothetical protein